MEARRLRGALAGGTALVAALVLAVGAGSASAAAPTLEFQPGPLVSFPIEFETESGAVTAVLSNFNHEVHCEGSEGFGEITGPRSAVGEYFFFGCEATTSGSPVPCQSEGGEPGEIETPVIDADLVFINQGRHEVGMLLAPGGETYMSFECAGDEVEAIGPFLSPVGPLNTESTVFTASLSRVGAIQAPAEYEGPSGEGLPAVPKAIRVGEFEGTTGVELSMGIFTEAPLTVRAITVGDEEAKKRDEEAKKRDEEAAEKKKHDDEEAAKTAAAKKKQEEEAAAKKRAEEEAAAKKKKIEAEQAKAKKQRTKALKQCRKNSPAKAKRVSCEKRAKKKYAVPHPNRRY
jgi:hypothetical protein